MRVSNYFNFLLVVFIFFSCDKEEDNNCALTAEFDRQEMVSHLTTQYIIPAYDDYLQKTDDLEVNVTSFLQTPSVEGLDLCKIGWQKVAIAWQNIAFLEFGPAENIGLRSQTNIYPVDTIKINQNISQGNAVIALPSNFDGKGIQSIEYLLFAPNKTTAELTSYYAVNNNARLYLSLIVSELKLNAQSVKDNWQDYSASFINNTSDNAQGSAVSSIVNAISAHYESFTRKGKLGIPAGIFNGFSQTPMPGHVEGLFSDDSFLLLKSQMTALQNFINGIAFQTNTEGLGLNNYMDFFEAKKAEIDLSMAINNQIDLILLSLNIIDTEPLSSAVTNQPSEIKALYQHMQKLVPLLKVDLTSALGVLITYQDNDGD